jgi:hypothetical protein
MEESCTHLKETGMAFNHKSEFLVCCFLKNKDIPALFREKIGGSSLLKNKVKNEKMFDRLLKLLFS